MVTEEINNISILAIGVYGYKGTEQIHVKLWVKNRQVHKITRFF